MGDTRCEKCHYLTAMRSSTQPRPRGALPKRERDHRELEALASLFHADWKPGDRVMTWINRHEGKAGELTRLIEDGWSWADLGRAMQLAGITYSTGEPLSAVVLRTKAYHSRVRMRAREAAGVPLPSALPTLLSPGQLPPAESCMPAAEESQLVHGVTRPAAIGAGPIESEQQSAEFQFQPARLRDWSGPKITREEETTPETNTVLAESPPVDADEVIDRLFGRQSSSRHEGKE